MKKFLIVVAIIILGAAGGAAARWFMERDPEVANISNFEECIAAGHPVMESNPRQCMVNGEVFVEESPNEYTSELGTVLHVNMPQANEEVSSPLTVRGEVPGSWSFEATFPVSILDSEGEVIAEGYATLTNDWMTDDLVPFEGTVEFPSQPSGSSGHIVLQKSNPSGLPEHDDEILIPIRF